MQIGSYIRHYIYRNRGEKIYRYGIVIEVENWHGQFPDEPNSDSDELIDVEQFVNVHWAHHLNSEEQCYTEVSLKKVASA